MTTCDLLIIFVDGEVKTVTGISNYEIDTKTRMFSFIKNEYRSFIPLENVKFFGRKIDWEEKQ